MAHLTKADVREQHYWLGFTVELVRLGAPDTRVIPGFFFCEALVVARKRICMIEERSLTSYLII